MTKADALLTLKLTHLAATGEAIARHDGLAVFVPYGLPGETVRVEIVQRQRSLARGRIVEMLEVAPDRVEPICPHFGQCGGCAWQHMDYSAQVAAKTALVREQLTRLGGLTDPSVLSCLPSPQPFGYRNHARLARLPDGRPAYRAAASHDLVRVGECPILEAPLAAALRRAAASAPRHPGGTRNPLGAAAPGEWDIRLAPTITVGDFTYAVAAESFFQVNTAVAALLVEQVRAACAPTRDDAILDLFCGVGLFTLPLAVAAGHVTGVESSASAARDARRNLAAIKDQLGDRRPQIITARADAALGRRDLRDRRWDAIVVDPPRAGLDIRTRTLLLGIAAPRLIYVSCDPATLARDLKAFCAGGYRLAAVQPLDMFPQTAHVEVVASLVRD
jgi:23S rRNA (uracil1939-C5)-methyltransferase